MVSTRNSTRKSVPNGPIPTSPSPGPSHSQPLDVKKDKGEEEYGQAPSLSALERHLQEGLSSVKELRKRMASLTRKNKKLESEIDDLRHNAAIAEPEDDHKSTPKVKELRSKVRKLEKEVASLQSLRARDKRKIQKLSLRELQEDAAQLQNEVINGPDDTGEVAIKLMRKFCETVTANSLAEDEECKVCLEKMEVEQATSLPCQHIVCNGCLEGLEKTALGKTIKCPECRQEAEEEGRDVIYFTAQQQWDDLLDMAQQWLKIDKYATEDATEDEDEEEEPPFIEEDMEPPTSSEAEETDPGEQNGRDVTPSPASEGEEESPLSYMRSPSSKKRKILQNLAKRRVKSKH